MCMTKQTLLIILDRDSEALTVMAKKLIAGTLTKSNLTYEVKEFLADNNLADVLDSVDIGYATKSLGRSGTWDIDGTYVMKLITL
jgi:hypothetical protein